MWWVNKFRLISILFFVLINCYNCSAQELFVISEPASNMPSKAISFRLTDKLMNGNRFSIAGHHDKTLMQRVVPEVMIGLNKKLMFHVSAYAANYYQSALKLEGFSMYAKYRFLSIDDLHKHFRMAAFSRVSVIDHELYFREVNLEGDNSGITNGIIATQLIHKLALSVAIGHVYVLDNISYQRPYFLSAHSLNYTVSAGYLLLPFHYKSYNQPNLNVYLEMQGRNSLSDYKTNIYELFPAVQLILKSYMRIDLGYRIQLKSNVTRNGTSGFLMRFEYNIFNAFQ